MNRNSVRFKINRWFVVVVAGRFSGGSTGSGGLSTLIGTLSDSRSTGGSSVIVAESEAHSSTGSVAISTGETGFQTCVHSLAIWPT